MPAAPISPTMMASALATTMRARKACSEDSSDAIHAEPPDVDADPELRN